MLVIYSLLLLFRRPSLQVPLYAQGQNLATFTKWTQFDPEDGNNIAAFEYPANRMFTFGVKLDF
jgi:hypothetical protein